MQTATERVRAANGAAVNSSGDFVLYWMTAYRRSNWNHSLDRAVAWAAELAKPLLVLEALRCDYPWASLRLHRFVLEGMADNARAFSRNRVAYYPYSEPEPGAGRGLLASLTKHACLVVTDDYPAFFIPRMIRTAAQSVPVLLEVVDSNGLIPLALHPRVFVAAHHFRHFLHPTVWEKSLDLPKQRPLAGRQLPSLDALPPAVVSRWRPAKFDSENTPASVAKRLPAQYEVSAADIRGGSHAAKAAMKDFLETRIEGYATLRNHPEANATSGLSPYLHFGHLSAHEVTHSLLERQEWTPDRIEPANKGKRSGWWGLDDNAEAFLDELLTWRELGFNAAAHQAGYDRYSSLPDWARDTLAAHESDIREHVYGLEEFEQAQTHDPLWNAAQRQLLEEGLIHGYLRMLWGKKILEWSPTAQHAFDIMVELNNKYALDGRDPNSYSGILWVLGKYDRPWAPERSIFGKVRYMSSENTARKFRLNGYLRRYGS